jgi:tetratricopeptide (TPR) repeat protein
LFDDEGRLIGITTYSIENGQSLNFALLANLVLTLKDHPYIEDIGAAGHDSESQAFELEGLASQKMGLGKYGEAVKLWRQALRLRPQNKDSWFNLGISYTLVGLCEDSIEAYQEAIRLEPELFHAWYWLGWTHELTKQYDKAIEAYKEAIRLKPDNVDAWVGLGEAYKGNQFPDEALKAYNEAIRLKPENDRAWLRLGTFHIQITRHYAEGISALREAARLEPDKADTWHWLAYAYHGQGDRERKLQALRRLESLDPKAARKFARDYK